jgi:hypothetical protein
MGRYVYTAKLVPLDRPVTIPDQNREPLTVIYREDTLALQAKRPQNIDLLLEHHRDLPIGKLSALHVDRGWWLGTFTVDDERIELEVGDPVSAGVYVLPWGSGEPILREVSLVTRAKVDGAQIVRKDRLPDLPAARASDPSAAAGEVIHGGQVIRRPGIGQVRGDDFPPGSSPCLFQDPRG